MAINEEASDDPRGKVISRFKVFWNDPSPKQVVVLQFPNRDRSQPYNNAHNLAPSQIRIKPITGLVEVDVPLNSLANGHFNKEKAIEFGSQLARNKVILNGGNFGLSGGFGAGGANTRHVRGVVDTSELPEDLDEAYEFAATRGKVLNTLTLTGKIQQFKEGDPIYAMATFRGDEMHLTWVNAICSLSPQYTHLDAATDNEKSSRIRESDSGAPETEARAVNVSMRSADTENVSPDHIGQTLRALQEEPWQRMQWMDEEADPAYLAFQNHLFYKDTDSTDRLVPIMSPENYLHAISAPKIDDKILGQKITQQHKAALADGWDEPTDSEESEVEIMREGGPRRQVTII